MTNGPLTIGWARGEITPPHKTLVQGQFHTRISDKIVSPLTATAMALEARDEDGAVEQAVFLSCDLPSEGFKDDLLRAIEGRCPDLDRRKITCNGTHTHNAPCVVSGYYDEPENDPEFMKPDEYRLWLAARLADVVERAWASRKPGSVARGFGYAVTGRCRRAVYADGSAAMYGDTNRPDFRGFEACADHAVNLLFAYDAVGDLTGVVDESYPLSVTATSPPGITWTTWVYLASARSRRCCGWTPPRRTTRISCGAWPSTAGWRSSASRPIPVPERS